MKPAPASISRYELQHAGAQSHETRRYRSTGRPRSTLLTTLEGNDAGPYEQIARRNAGDPRTFAADKSALCCSVSDGEHLRPRAAFRILTRRDIVDDGKPGHDQYEQQVEHRVWGPLFVPERVTPTPRTGRCRGIKLHSTDRAFVGGALFAADSCWGGIESDKVFECYRAFHALSFSAGLFSHWPPAHGLRRGSRIRYL